jgi:hypothetical protein
MLINLDVYNVKTQCISLDKLTVDKTMAYKKCKPLFYLVPGAGIEPARCCQRGILSPVRLPIPPPGHLEIYITV